MQAEIWETIKNNYAEHEKYELRRRDYVRGCWWAIRQGLSKTKFEAKKFPKKFEHEIMSAQGREVLHPKFDIFYDNVTPEDVLLEDFWEIVRMYRYLWEHGKIPYEIDIKSAPPEALNMPLAPPEHYYYLRRKDSPFAKFGAPDILNESDVQQVVFGRSL